jgi:hypothetical protein
MKPLRLTSLLALVLAVCGLSTPAMAQYRISWYKIAGGGGTSTNGQYAISGTIGQHDAGTTMSGGNYTLTGGFWTGVSVIQTPGAPLLNIISTNSGTVTLSWGVTSTPFYLQQVGSLAAGNWATLNTNSYPVNIVGTNNQVTVPATGSSFFRLKYP